MNPKDQADSRSNMRTDSYGSPWSRANSMERGELNLRKGTVGNGMAGLGRVGEVKFAYGDDEVTVTHDDEDGGRRADAGKGRSGRNSSYHPPTPGLNDPKRATIASSSKATGSKSGRGPRA